MMTSTSSPPSSAGTSAAARLAEVRERVAMAARRAGRSPQAVSIVAVSKGFGVDAIEAVRQAGQVEFGENRSQELRRKARALGGGIRWHFVGRLQRNKVRHVVGVAGLIHSVDRLELAEEIARRAQQAGRVQPVLVQVNVGDDPAKGGCAIDAADALVAQVRSLPGVACQGFMTMPPFSEDPRPLFARLRDLRDAVRERFPEVQHLSMGMSADFETAVEEGATIVRVGEAIFGPRPHPE